MTATAHYTQKQSQTERNNHDVRFQFPYKNDCKFFYLTCWCTWTIIECIFLQLSFGTPRSGPLPLWKLKFNNSHGNFSEKGLGTLFPWKTKLSFEPPPSPPLKNIFGSGSALVFSRRNNANYFALLIDLFHSWAFSENVTKSSIKKKELI